MSIVIPTFTLRNILTTLINNVIADYNTAITNNLESECWLYRVFNGVKYGEFDFYQQAINILVLRGDDDFKKLQIRLDFDPSIAKNPCIFINNPSEVELGMNAIGMNEDTNLFYNNDDDSSTEISGRTFEGNYEILITSSNYMEMELLYRLVQCLFIANYNTISNTFGGIFKLSGRQLIFDESLMPDTFFSKVWNISVQNTISVPRMDTISYANDVKFVGTILEE